MNEWIKSAEFKSLFVVYMLILVSWSHFHIALHSAVDAQEKLQHGHRMELLSGFTCLKHANYLTFTI